MYRRCRICENSQGNTTIVVREMMYGTRDPFEYLVCAGCGCVQIAEVPENLSDYYPDDYYSFTPAERPGPFATYLQGRRAAHLLGRPNLLGWLMVKRFGVPPTIGYVKKCGVHPGHSVLEVGSGTGELLLAMRAYGFTDLTGVDPFVGESVDYGNGVRVFKSRLEDYDGRHNLVMLHHTFEHMDEPLAVLRRIASLLVDGGYVLVRIPVASCEAFETYGADWVQLDAPRHLYLHTPNSMALLAGRAGFDVTDVVYDSTAFQFLGSEQYRRDIPLRDSRSYKIDPRNSIFTKAEMETFEARARRLNATGRGDQAAFYLRKAARS